MSKKKKKKFNAKLAQVLVQTKNEPEQKISEHTAQTTTKVTKQETRNITEQVDTEDKNLTKIVRHEMKAILGAMLICMIILVGIWYIQIKTPYINNFSNWLTTSLHIKAN